MQVRLRGRNALITGAGRGIGREIALALAAEGAGVVLAARSTDQVEKVAAEVGSNGAVAVPISCDVTSDEAVAELAAAARDHVGQVDIVVNCAGVRVGKPFSDCALADYRLEMEVNFLAVVRVIQAFVWPMVERGWGRIITVASTAGKYGSLDQSGYNASKHAVVGLTRCLALELGTTGVTVNAICPGFVATDMLDEAVRTISGRTGESGDAVVARLVARVPMGRLLKPAEIAPLAAYVASDDSSGMTGQSLSVCGGLVLV